MSMAPLRQAGDGLYRLIGEVLHANPSSLTDASSPETVRGWDSLRSILLVSAVEQRYQVTLTLAEIMGIRSLGDLKAALAKRGVQVDA
ncbi:MAG: acyl carrier protein [Candidatus Omnitrophica bacterium]|nr:acyl carrier protein [Candidatus Omnitrophota bacterium]